MAGDARWSAAFTLGVFCAAVLAACGGKAKPRPDLLFVSSRSGVYALYAMNADGSRQARLTDVPDVHNGSTAGLFFQMEPSWSPDGRAIAFSSNRSGVSEIYVVRADGTRTRRLTDTSGDASHPAWSPDGRMIAFEVGDPTRLYVMRADGGASHALGGGGASQADPAWSPDGTRIAYVRREPGGPLTELWVMRSDGSKPRRITRLNALVESPAWSPDGRKIAFASNRGGHFEIYVMSPGGGAVSRRTTSSADDLEPEWSPDGGLIAFSRDGAIATVDSAGHVTTITDPANNDSNPVWNPVPVRPG